MKVTLLRDKKPGHYNQSEGILLALKRITQISDVHRIDLKRSYILPQRLLRALYKNKTIPLSTLWALTYSTPYDTVPITDLVISAGGDTLLANAILANKMNTKNIFSGSIRTLDPHHFSAVISPYTALKNQPNHIIALKPSPLDPDKATSTNKSNTISLILGGPSGDYLYTDTEWEQLLKNIKNHADQNNKQLEVFTSRRTPDAALKVISKLNLKLHHPKDTRIENVFEHNLKADYIFVTEDSTSMISEAIITRKPVITVRPQQYVANTQDINYLNELIAQNYIRSISLSHLSEKSIHSSLAQIQPLKSNHLDILADQLKAKLL